MSRNNWVMEKLARSLTESERIEFLRQIHASLRDNELSQNRLVRHESDREEKKVLLQQDIRKLPPLRYFLLWIKKIFTGKSMTNLFLEMRINKMKRQVRQSDPGLASFETRTLKPALPEKVFRIFIQTIPLQNLFKKVWRNEKELNFFHQLVFSMIEDNLPDRAESCYDLIDVEDLVKMYLSGGTRQVIFGEIERNIDTYVDSIDSSVFEKVERQLAPLYSLRDLVLFPYQSLFKKFNGTIRRDDPETVPMFQRTSAITSLDMIEELYYALYHAAKMEMSNEFDTRFTEQLFSAAYNQNSGEDDDAEESEEEDDSPGIQIDTDQGTFLDDIKDLQMSAQKLLKEIPLPQLIRAFKEDPYYRLVVYVPSIEIVDFYRNMKKLSLRNEIEEIIRKIRQEALTRERGRLFEGMKIRALHYYRSYSSIDYEKTGLTSFRYYQGLLVLYNFLSVFYKGPIQRILQILEGFIPEQDRITRERMLKYASAAEDALYKIRELDDSLSPDHDDGKKFQRLRFETNMDPVQKRIYFTTLSKKDAEARELLMKGRDAQRGIRLLFKEFLENHDSIIQQALQKKYMMQGKVVPLHEVLDQNIGRIELLEKIELQLDNIRDETGFDEVAI